ncbi:uncharacterized protein K460DRAFT_179871 [Cucurbitaria berberidis CBS 394.84]|uniref:Secreted protein n=1 Tax=Cucurbitaria berberidis CBS 394.84 TaxID=1168544 RepID=A0A9P4GBE8_9PLEO|nr:uncharacterized protein K460DRAFT_179871 [Cucurbitaria berberidis CBS 394.84]KAF1842169.1 hypothetical protein K460DRAFT_179871 [Cucurbitaria berberidis CBS 394.84]
MPEGHSSSKATFVVVLLLSKHHLRLAMARRGVQNGGVEGGPRYLWFATPRPGCAAILLFQVRDSTFLGRRNLHSCE